MKPFFIGGFMVTQERLKELLDYDKDTGIFTWKVYRSNNAPKGGEAGKPDNKGYVLIQIDGKVYKAHRLAWLYVYGGDVPPKLDHKNRIKNDNRIDNLREATINQNAYNAGLQKNNTSGYKGVSFYSRDKKWVAQCHINMKRIYIGQFDTALEASKAYDEFTKPLHKEFHYKGASNE